MHPKSKFFRASTTTTDGRTIQRDWLVQMAKNFNTAKYGARIWLEHIRGITPDSGSPFKAYADVTAVKAEEVDIDGTKKMALFAQIQPRPPTGRHGQEGPEDLHQHGESPKFSAAPANLTGLASPTAPPAWAPKCWPLPRRPEASPFKGRKRSPDALFTEAIEAAIEWEPADNRMAQKFGDTIKGILDKFKANSVNDDARFTQVAELNDMADDEQCNCRRSNSPRNWWG